MSNTCYIALGSNLGNPRSQIDQALSAIKALGSVSALSPYYRSQAIGPGQQDDYINAVLCLHTALSAHDLLDQLQAIENCQGRMRLLRWGPRTLDLDILLFNDQVISDDTRLMLPHPRLCERNFVVFPLFDIAAELILPNGQTLAEIKARLNQQGLEKLPQTR